MNAWRGNFDQATEAYTQALHSGAWVIGPERAKAAKTFRAWIDYFKLGGEPARAVIRAELQDQDIHRFSTAARLCVECGEADYLARLSQNDKRIRASIAWPDMKRLWLILRPSKAQYDEWTQTDGYPERPLLQALLDQPTQDAYE